MDSASKLRNLRKGQERILVEWGRVAGLMKLKLEADVIQVACKVVRMLVAGHEVQREW